MMTCAMPINEGPKPLYSPFKPSSRIILVRAFIVDVYGTRLGIADANACECCTCKRVFATHNGLVTKIVAAPAPAAAKMCAK